MRFTVFPTTEESGLNKTEQAFLAWLRAQPERFVWVGVQSITLKLGWDCRLTPDFATIDAAGQMTFWDTKGTRNGRRHVEDDAQAKMAAAARLYRWARFATAHKGPRGEWVITEVKP